MTPSIRTLGVALAVAALGAVTGCGASGTSGASRPSATGGTVPVVATIVGRHLRRRKRTTIPDPAARRRRT